VAHSSIGNPWRFACKRKDEETGWIYFGRRFYDPQIGRWTTPDPLLFADGPNLYAYLHHQPLMAHDLYGLVGEAYVESTEAALNIDYYMGASKEYVHYFSESDRQGISSPLAFDPIMLERTIVQTHHAFAGVLHGGVDFCSRMVQDFASMACVIGSQEEPFEERLSMQSHFFEWQNSQQQQLDRWITGALQVDPDHSTYQSCRYGTSLGLEIGSYAIAGAQLARGTLSVMRGLARSSLAEAKVVSQIARKEMQYAVSRGAESVNAGVNLNKKLSLLQDKQQSAVHTRLLPDGRVRYYDAKRTYRTEGPTNGASFVTEYNFATGRVRAWNECYDCLGNVNRIHPKNLNGQDLLSPHYPLIASEIR
jgi:RHS repeat-associated protein